MKKQSFFIILSLFLCSCAITKKTAPIEYHFGGQQVTKKTVTSFKPKPIIDIDEGEIIDNTNINNEVIDIKQDDKFIEVANKNTIEEDDLFVTPNQISDHNNSGSKIKETEIKEQIVYHEVQDGETIDDVARKYNVSTQNIIEDNELVPPYYLDEFQILKIKTDKKTTIKVTNIEDEDAQLLNEEIKPLVKENISIVKKTVTSEFIPPLQGEIIAKFGDKTELGINKGISIAAKPGTKILASAKGKVIYADYDATFGNLVIIKLDNKNIVTSYAHMQDIILKKGSNVEQDDVIDFVGSTGKVKQPQLHFGIREGKIARDPMNYVKNI